jgi:hypothetical protein
VNSGTVQGMCSAVVPVPDKASDKVAVPGTAHTDLPVQQEDMLVPVLPGNCCPAVPVPGTAAGMVLRQPVQEARTVPGRSERQGCCPSGTDSSLCPEYWHHTERYHIRELPGSR